MPWDQLRVPHEVDGSQGQFRAPQHVCLLKASNDCEAVQSWLSLHESAATQRGYRKEAERLILWAILERGRANAGSGRRGRDKAWNGGRSSDHYRRAPPRKR